MQKHDSNSSDDHQVDSHAELMQRIHAYQPELPRHILSQAVGMQGDRTRLERVMAAMIRGDDKGI